MRLMSYNIEWFTKHFEGDNSLRTTPESVAKLDAVARVISETDADLIGMTEAPNTTTTTGERNTVTALENFAQAKGLRQRKALLGFPSRGQQEIALLYDPDTLSAAHDPGGRPTAKANTPFNKPFQIDSDDDDIEEVYEHYRPPLEVAVTRQDGGASFWLIVVHAKSKGIFSNMDRLHFERVSERNRRKLFAECSSVRLRVDEWLASERPVVVMGDINDGPGFDYHEARFGRSAVEIILGDLYSPENVLRYPVGRPLWGRYGWRPASARFQDTYTHDHVDVLIDHIMVSRHLQMKRQTGRVWNPVQDDDLKPLKKTFLTASDHFPVTVDLE